jgi:hypothetical protein
MAHRQLTSEEIRQLEQQSCLSADWRKIMVDQHFDPSRVHHVHFSGSCKLGDLSGQVEDSQGGKHDAGIYWASLHNVTLGNRVLVSRVGNLSNYEIEDHVSIQNVNELFVSGKTHFGNGTEIEVLNEGGGRDLIIYDQLNAQIAYLLVMYRHRPGLVGLLNQMIRDYCKTRLNTTGRIGKNTRIANCKIIHNVVIGDYVVIEGAELLEEGTISGDPDEKTQVGIGVIARHFIILSGSIIDSAALIDKCFIGQGNRIGKQFSAENSVFFANTEGFHGEAVSLFAGPYTVTHHKSTLMIAGYFSFFNAGSGTNQSNHMYKLGPIHQGIVERGSKTGSFAYLLWPSRVGPFSVVMGKHGANFDAADLPFSYITVENDRTMLTPAMNLLTVGTRRDTEKWPKRDRRKGSIKLDLIHFDLFNPYVMNRVLNGMEILGDLYEKTPKEQEFVNYKGLRMKRLMLKTCRKYYEMAWHIFLGDMILKRLSNPEPVESLEEVDRRLKTGRKLMKNEWNDICGLTVPAEVLETLLDDIEQHTVGSLEEVQDRLLNIYRQYDEFSLSWMHRILSQKFNMELSKPGKDDLIRIIDNWKTNSVRLDHMILSDAKKEFDPGSQIGFGLDGDEEIKKADFEQVRGNFEENGFVKGIQKEIADIEKMAEEWISRINKLN